MTTHHQIKDALATTQLQVVASQLGHLPGPNRFKSQVESDLWNCIVPPDKQEATEVAYEELTSKGQEVIGYIESNGGDATVPWWLTAFKWEVTTIGEDSVTLDSVDNLEQFEDFIIGETTIEKPELLHQQLGVSNDLCGALANFDQIYTELTDHIDVPKETETASELALPDQSFKITNGRVQTTEAFQGWVQSIIQLCPPFNESLTALLLVLSKADAEVAQEVLSDQVIANLEAAGVFDGDTVFNGTYFDALGTSGNSLLTHEWEVFDIQLPYVNDSYEYLAPLEAAFYETWLEQNTAVTEQHKDWFILTGGSAKTITSQAAFAQVSLRSPMAEKRGQATYCTLSLRKSGRFSTTNNQQGKRRELNQLLAQHGITEDDTR